VRKFLPAALLAAGLSLLSCGSLMDSRAWGNGLGGRDEAPASDKSARGTSQASANANTSANASPAARGSGSAVARQVVADEDGSRVLARAVSAGKGTGDLVVKAAMARVEKGTILKGSCYDFANAVYADAGFKGKSIKSIYLGKEKGPFADPALIQTGDWLYFTHMYSGTLGHSAIFIAWLDFENRTALTIDYPGENRAEPGRYRVADLYKVWGINRAVR
jgi:hypothetical protein